MDEFSIRSKMEYERALDRFPYPFEIVHGQDALSAYEELKAAGRGTPLVLGGASEFAMVDELYWLHVEDGRSVSATLKEASTLRFPESLDAAKTRDMEALRRRFPEILALSDDHEPPLGNWPESVGTSPGLTVATHYSGVFWPRVHIALIPTDDWTETPAFLLAGGWNACPVAAIQVTALRAWRDRYEAELVGYSHDTMNLRVRRGPTSRDEALLLAREHYEFCNDVIDQGAETFANLAASLIEGDWWFFWWD